VRTSCCEVPALVKVEGCFLQRETPGGSLKLELWNGPERGVGWCEIEAYHGEKGLDATNQRLQCGTKRAYIPLKGMGSQSRGGDEGGSRGSGGLTRPLL